VKPIDPDVEYKGRDLHSRVGGNNVRFDSARCPNLSIQQLNISTVEYYTIAL